eukprot:COSAG02_NODE_22821_length_739_cov_1.151563_1_plen_161_part_10
MHALLPRTGLIYGRGEIHPDTHQNNQSRTTDTKSSPSVCLCASMCVYMWSCGVHVRGEVLQGWWSSWMSYASLRCSLPASAPSSRRLRWRATPPSLTGPCLPAPFPSYRSPNRRTFILHRISSFITPLFFSVISNRVSSSRVLAIRSAQSLLQINAIPFLI